MLSTEIFTQSAKSTDQCKESNYLKNFILNIGTSETPYSTFPKFRTIDSERKSILPSADVSKNGGQVAKSVDPEQMPHSAASDLGLHCLLRSTVPILRVYTLSITFYNVCHFLLNQTSAFFIDTVYTYTYTNTCMFQSFDNYMYTCTFTESLTEKRAQDKYMHACVCESFSKETTHVNCLMNCQVHLSGQNMKSVLNFLC